MLTNASFTIREVMISIACVNGNEFSIRMTRMEGSTLVTSETFRLRTPKMRAILKELHCKQKRVFKHKDMEIRCDNRTFTMHDGTRFFRAEGRDGIIRLRRCIACMLPETPTEKKARIEKERNNQA